MQKRSRSKSTKRRTKKPRLSNRFQTVGLFGKPKQELKRMDTGQSNTAISSTPFIIPLNVMKQGTDDYQRIGKEVTLKSLHMIGSVVLSGVIDNTFDYHRYMIVYDRQPNGALPAIADILRTVDVNGAFSTNCFSHKNEDTTNRFLILRDRKFGIPGDSQSALHSTVSMLSTPVAGTIDEYIRLKDLKTQFRSNSGNITSIDTGALLFVPFWFQSSS